MVISTLRAQPDITVTQSQIRSNVRWSKILIHSIPTGVSEEQVAFSPEECHKALTKENPMYTTLTVTQPPSWI
ncbi:hypothetical protein BJV74DRAFT_870909 [Russula compacta]|nr:hypothetical protein BJV74DRAFT_870909 [Russula compacta]